MSGPPGVSEEAIARVQRLAERRLSRAELEAYVGAPYSAGEREEWLSLVAWFTRRYPTVLERLEYNLRRSRELFQLPPGLRPPPPLRLPETPVVDLDAPPEDP